MTISINPTDFGGDILGFIQPFAEALGLSENGGDLDFSKLNIDDAMNILESYDRTDKLLDILSSVVGLPESVYRHKVNGLLNDNAVGSDYSVEEWFKIYTLAEWGLGAQSGSCTLFLTTHHNDGPGDEHELYVGLGFSLEHSVVISGTPNTFELKLSIPIVKLYNDGTAPTTINHPSKVAPLIWADEGGLTAFDIAMSRMSAMARLYPSDGSSYPNSSTYPNCSAIAFKAAVGNGGSKITLTLEDFKTDSSSIPEDQVIDSWNSVGGAVLDTVIPLIINKLSDDPALIQITDNLLPMIGLTAPAGKPDWPRMDYLQILLNLEPGGESGIWQELQNWFQSLLDYQDGISTWLEHLGGLLGVGSITVNGTGTVADPWAVDIASLIGLSGVELNVLVATYIESGSERLVQLGIQVSHTVNAFTSQIDFTGSFSAWLLRISTQGNPPVLLPSLDGLVEMSKTNLTKLIDIQFDPDDGGPMDPIDVETRSIRAGLRMDETHSLVPILELTDVLLGDTSWPVMDLTSADTPAEILDAAQNILRDQLSSLFEDNGVLQCLGSVLGLCAPRGGAFADIWEGNTGGGNDLRADPFNLVTDPLGSISDYYKQLVTTEIPVPSGGSPTCAWLFVFESIGMLVKTAIEQMLDGSYIPIIPTMEAPELVGSGASGSYVLLGSTTESPMVSITTSFDNSPTSPNIGLGLDVIFARLDVAFEVELTLKLTGELASFSFDQNSNSVDTNLLGDVGLLTVISKESGPIEIAQIGCISLTIDDITGGVSWSQDTGIEWFVEANSPEINWAYPDLADDELGFDQLKHVDWDGLVLTMPDGTTMEPPSSGPVTYFQGELEEFDLEFVRKEFIMSDLRYGSQGFSAPDPSSIDPEIVRGLIGQLLVYKCGSLGFFVGVFFRIHPDMIHLNLGAHVIRNDIIIPDYYSTVTTGEWPADWKLMHKSDPASFGLGPLSLPSDWPILDVVEFCSEPWAALKQFSADVLSGISSSGEPFAFPAMKWIYSLLHGNIPSLNHPDLGWGTNQLGVSQYKELEVPDVPIQFQGSGSYHNPWRVAILDGSAGRFDFLFWVGPDGLPHSSMVDTSIAMLGDELVAEMEEGLSEMSSMAVGGNDWATTFARLLKNLAQFSPRTREAIHGRSESELIDSFTAIATYLTNSDGITSLNNQADVALEYPASSTQASDVFTAGYTEAPYSAEVQDEIFQYIDGNALPNAKVLIVNSPWQVPFAWEDFLVRACTSPRTDNVHSDLNARLFDFDVAGVSDYSTLDFNNLGASDYYVMQPSRNSGDELEDLRQQVKISVEEIAGFYSAIPETIQILLIGHSAGGLLVREYLHATSTSTHADGNVSGACVIATPHGGPGTDDPLLTFSSAMDGAHILESLGFNIQQFSPGEGSFI